jgi:tyramine---L-glutamate ligase
MCRAALLDALHSGHTVTTVLEPGLPWEPLRAAWAPDQLRIVPMLAGQAPFPVWCQAFADCDATLVIAPESGRLLATVLAEFARFGLRTLNACDPFLERSSDKWLTAQRLHDAGIAHPPTRLLSHIDPDWLEQPFPGSDPSTQPPQEFAVKQRDGVGCDGLRRLSPEGVLELQDEAVRGDFDATAWIVQPWLAGVACSTAAIVDGNGSARWLPATRQEVAWTPKPHYQGGRVAPDLFRELLLTRAGEEAAGHWLDELVERLEQHCASLLAATLRALGSGARGWIGVDWLAHLDWPAQPITILEVNPRLTTSFVGLSVSGGGGLIDALTADCSADDAQPDYGLLLPLANASQPAAEERFFTPTEGPAVESLRPRLRRWLPVHFQADGHCEPPSSEELHGGASTS